MLETVQAGQPLELNAADHNAFVAAARAHRGDQQFGGGPRGTAAYNPAIAIIKNNTGATANAGDALEIGYGTVGQTINANYVSLGDPYFFGGQGYSGSPGFTNQNHDAAVAILAEPIPNQRYGRGYVAGIVVAKLYNNHQDHKWANLAFGQNYLSSDYDGTARILWRENPSSTGLQKAIVQLGYKSGRTLLCRAEGRWRNGTAGTGTDAYSSWRSVKARVWNDVASSGGWPSNTIDVFFPYIEGKCPNTKANDLLLVRRLPAWSGNNGTSPVFGDFKSVYFSDSPQDDFIGCAKWVVHSGARTIAVPYGWAVMNGTSNHADLGGSGRDLTNKFIRNTVGTGFGTGGANTYGLAPATIASILADHPAHDHTVSPHTHPISNAFTAANEGGPDAGRYPPSATGSNTTQTTSTQGAMGHAAKSGATNLTIDTVPEYAELVLIERLDNSWNKLG